MKKLQKLLGGAAILGMLVFQTATVSANDGMEYIKAEYQAIANVTSMGVKGSGSILCPLAKATGSMDSTFLLRPTLKAQGTFHGDMLFIAGEPFAGDMPFYINCTNDQLVLYLKDPKRGWEKSTTSIENLPASLAMTPEKMAEALGMIKKADVISETDTSRVLQVTLDGEKFGEAMKKSASIMKKSPYYAQQSEILAGLSQDLTYTEKINKKTNLPESTAVDLSQPLRTAFMAALNQFSQKKQVNPEQVKIQDLFFNNTTAQEEVTYGPFNEVKEIIIPAEVLAAPEMKKPEHKKKVPATTKDKKAEAAPAKTN